MVKIYTLPKQISGYAAAEYQYISDGVTAQ